MPGSVSLDTLYNEARTHTAWLDKAIDEKLLHDAYDLMKMGPTSANCSPLRILFLQTDEAKARLKSEKTLPKGSPKPVSDARQINVHHVGDFGIVLDDPALNIRQPGDRTRQFADRFTKRQLREKHESRRPQRLRPTTG